MKIRSLIALALTCLSPQFVQADVLCIDAGGYYGFIRLAETASGLTIHAKQGYAVEISRKLGFPEGAEASEIWISPLKQCSASHGLLRCQGPAVVKYKAFRNGSGEFNAVVDVHFTKTPNGPNVALSIAVPATGKMGRASRSFFPPLGGCTGNLK